MTVGAKNGLFETLIDCVFSIFFFSFDYENLGFGLLSLLGYS